jgi:hypothetical protein
MLVKAFAYAFQLIARELVVVNRLLFGCTTMVQAASAIAMPDRCTWCVWRVKVKVILPELSAAATPVAVAASEAFDVVVPFDTPFTAYGLVPAYEDAYW